MSDLFVGVYPVVELLVLGAYGVGALCGAVAGVLLTLAACGVRRG